jgi:hypothetical protein
MNKDIKLIISNTLSNIYDWESEDLKGDFINFIQSEYKIEESKLSKIFDEFNSLPAIERESISFDINYFVSKHLN